MTHHPAPRNYSEQQAGALRSGDHLLLPDGNRSAEVHRIEVETDDFGTAAIVLATLTGGGVLRIAAGSTVKVPAADKSPDTGAAGQPEPAAATGHPAAPAPAPAPAPKRSGAGEAGDAAVAAAVVVPPLPPAPPVVSGPSEEDLALIPALEGTPEAVVEKAAAAHPGAVGVLLLGERLAKGINTKSGSCLKDLSDLAHELYIILKDAENALAVADLLNVLPFDGNPGRWASVEASLALSSYICRQLGQEERAAAYERFLRAPDAMETDPFKARINAKVRQRSLNEPNFYDKEIFRSIDSSNPEAEREWRLLRLEALLFLRAHGGSETIGAPELERRIGHELDSVRA